jgi:hypothetical protein
MRTENNLTQEEFRMAMALYESATGRHWLPTEDIESQAVWVIAFEQAKIYFGAMDDVDWNRLEAMLGVRDE